MRIVLVPLAAIALVVSVAAFGADTPDKSDARAACRPDAQKLCAGVQPGGGHMLECLKQNEAQLSAPCKEALAKMRERRSPPPASPQG